MIDLHTHVLPGIDDGPDDLAGSVAVAEVAAHGGIRTLVATPHLRADHPGVRPAELAGARRELTEHLRARGLPVEVLPGAEVDLQTAAGLADEELALATLAGNGARPAGRDAVRPAAGRLLRGRVLALAARGFRITLAHPERSPTFQEDPAAVGALVEQRRAGPADGAQPQRSRSAGATTARTLLEHGWAHVLASDAHAIDRRPPDLGAALSHAAEPSRTPRAELEWMVTAAPRAILDGRPLPERPPRASRRRRAVLRRR